MGSSQWTVGKTFYISAPVGSPFMLFVWGGVQVPSALSKGLSSLRVWVLLFLQEVSILRSQLGDKLQIKLDVEPTVDMSRVLQEMRCHYEAMVQTNHNDLEEWFQDQVRVLPRSREGPWLPPGQVADHVSVPLCFSLKASASRTCPAPRSCGAASRRSWS